MLPAYVTAPRLPVLTTYPQSGNAPIMMFLIEINTTDISYFLVMKVILTS